MSTTQKKGRGRPRKHPIAASAASSSAAVDLTLTQEQLLTRKTEIQNRLLQLEPQPIIVAPDIIISAGGGGGDNNNNASSTKALFQKLPTSIAKLPIPSTNPSTTTTTDKSTHWDFTLKEMLWLSADFQSERKRQISQAKKLSNAIKQYHATLHTRKIRERAEFEARVRRLGAKLNRNVQRGYWKKIERVVGYKQRLDGEEQRKKDMDKHLVFLVRQTEKYGESLTKGSVVNGSDGDAGIAAAGRNQQMTIEEALSQSALLGRRKSTLTSVDYSRMDRDESYNERTFYGERVMVANTTNARLTSSSPTTAMETEDDADEEYEPSDTEIMEEAENEKSEYIEFLTSFREQCPDDVREEVNKLLEEQEMDLDTLLQRLVEEGQQMEAAEEEEDGSKNPPGEEVMGEPMEIDESSRVAPRRRHVSFAASHQEKTFDPSPSVESILGEDDHEEKDEFHLENEEVDDETTIEAEERLGRDMSYTDEIELLNRENEMSVEELRAMYASMQDGNDEPVEGTDNNNNNDDDVETENDLSMLAEDDYEEKDEFHIESDEKDDETTIEAEEKLGRDMSYQDEIDLLQREGEMSIEELRAMYANMENGDDTDTQQPREDEAMEETAMSLLAEDDHEEQDEFHLDNVEVDDETTLEAEEKLGRDMSYQDEIDLLKRESEMSVEELRAMYANMEDGGVECDDEKEAGTATSALDLLNEDDHEEKDEFHMEEDEVDDETTIEAEEKLGRDMSYEQELSQLQEESEMSTEELRRLYGLDADEDGTETSTQKPEKRKLEAADDPDDGKSAKKTKNDSDEGIAALQTLAASDEKARQTMLTRPFLLASWVKLRAYQQVGMNWLVSAQSRRLNSILADEMGLGQLVKAHC
eukprot:scaffold16192_cov121-Skeletonema_dohrnii-CCMP3373.AAC.1